MEKYKELVPRLPQDRYFYAILTELVELNKKLDKLMPIQSVSLNEEKKPRRKKKEVETQLPEKEVK